MKRIFAAALSTAGIAAASLVAFATPADAGQGTGNPVLDVSSPVVAPDRVTDITVTGTDYLVPPYGEGADVFGGVYVFFGWVADPNRFGPSIRNSENNDGTLNTTYAYPGDGGDANVRDDGSGVVRLVAFTPGGESGQATDFHMDRDGNWSTSLRIYGSTFTTTNPVTGESLSYDCTQVQCGVFTIGAHGIASATNEKFIPITFDAAAGQAAPLVLAEATTTSTTTSTTTTSTTAPTTTAPPITTAPSTAPAASVPADSTIAATIATSTSTGSGRGQLVVVSAGLLGLTAVVAAWRWRRRRNASAHPAQVPTTNTGGIRP